jgi:uncharacterized protein YjbI with pentapeptide repeats
MPPNCEHRSYNRKEQKVRRSRATFVEAHVLVACSKLVKADVPVALSALSTFTRDRISLKFKAIRFEFDEITFIGCLFKNIVAEGAYLSGANFIGCTFDFVDWYDCHGTHVTFENCIFKKCDLNGSSFYDSHFGSCRFEDCDPSENNMDSKTVWKDTSVEQCEWVETEIPRLKKN